MAETLICAVTKFKNAQKSQAKEIIYFKYADSATVECKLQEVMNGHALYDEGNRHQKDTISRTTANMGMG